MNKYCTDVIHVLYFLAVFYKRCLKIHGLPATFQKLINCIIRGWRGMERAGGNNRFGNMDYWWVHVLEGARVAQWWAHSPPTNVAWVQLPASTPYVGWVCYRLSPLLREVFSGYSGCPLFSKTNTSKFQFDLERTDTFKRVHMNS